MASVQGGVKNVFGGITDAIKAPFRVAAGLLEIPLGIVSAPFKLLFGGGNKAAPTQQVQQGVTQGVKDWN